MRGVLTAMNSNRELQMAAVSARIRACRACEGMNVPGVTQAAPGYGSPRSPVVLVGQSLCGQPCMESQIPFTGGSGRFIDQSLEVAGLGKDEVFTTNVVHCHPPDNRRSHALEIKNCRPHLVGELEIIKPRLVVGLGKDAAAVLREIYPDAGDSPWPFPSRRPAKERAGTSPTLLSVPHPSWVKFQPREARERWVSSLARALKWAFHD